MNEREDLRLLLHAAVDGELDAAGLLALERAMASDSGLAAEYERLRALQSALRDRLPRTRASAALRLRLASRLAPPAPIAAPRLSSRRWPALAATALVAAGLSSALTWRAARQRGPTLSDQLVSDHMRGLLATAPVDVVSSDEHTVKPWFDVHLALSPPVPDLSAQGFELVGGRVDVIDAKPAPTIVYRIRKHLISVTAAPVSQAGPNRLPATLAGYRIIGWRDADFQWWAVSDVDSSTFQAFVKAFRAASGSNNSGGGP